MTRFKKSTRALPVRSRLILIERLGMTFTTIRGKWELLLFYILAVCSNASIYFSFLSIWDSFVFVCFRKTKNQRQFFPFASLELNIVFELNKAAFSLSDSGKLGLSQKYLCMTRHFCLLETTILFRLLTFSLRGNMQKTNNIHVSAWYYHENVTKNTVQMSSFVHREKCD